ncbi:protein LAZY 1-like isoform X2 [Salvia hispanica]|uniref:protein LAZY 1-like isoform X2 n=1 Tax=Salvia hispanica TaxID=49212 RepID=UPI0020093823|nr:protein LAZY 1-like isoform X2 [Salvia hispanica]
MLSSLFLFNTSDTHARELNSIRWLTNRTVIFIMISGNPCGCLSVQTFFDEKNYHVEPTKYLYHSKNNFHKSSNRFESDEVERLFQEELFEPFEFLAIGTLGMELQGTDPPTPTLPMPSDDLTNYRIEITENDLQLINYELEKFLEAADKELANETSGRSSQASIITLSNKPIEGEDSDGQTFFTDFPLQSYLLANSIEVAETNNATGKEKTSLEDLFRRNNIAHTDPAREFKGAEQRSRKRNVTCFMKKVVKKFHSSSSSSTTTSTDGDTVPISMKKKLSKVLKKLQRKVHPEDMTGKHILHKDVFKTEVVDGNKMLGPAPRKTKENSKKLSSDDICKGSSTTNGGHWIKTDSDYLVLEL